MKCSESKFNISLELDDMLDASDSVDLRDHLTACKICSAEAIKQKKLRHELYLLPKAVIPQSLLNELRSAGKSAAAGMNGGEMFAFHQQPRGFSTWLLPTFAASTVTIVLGFALISSILSGYENIGSFEVASNSGGYSKTSVFIPGNTPIERSFELDSAVREFALSRASVAKESPTINPNGTLVSLAGDQTSKKGSNGEITVVADVFSNGIAKIAQVLDSAGDHRSIEDLQKALSSDPQFAPFVPAEMDNRSGTMRVVLLIQNVEVDIGRTGKKDR